MYQAFIFEFGLVPCRLADACPARLETLLAGAPSPWLTVFTSMFVHGGLFHVGGNMLYLWIFGNNVEDVDGQGRFLVFYLACGVGGGDRPVPDRHGLAGPNGRRQRRGLRCARRVPAPFPGARVWTLMGFGFFWRFVPVPAVIVLGFWIVVQVINGVLTFGRGEPGGVAFLAHVGGFVAGMALVDLFRRRPRASYRRW